MQTESYKKNECDYTFSVTPSNGPQSGFMDFQGQYLTLSVLPSGSENVHTHKHIDATIMENSLAECNPSIHVPYEPVVPFLGIYPRKIHT